MKKKKFWVLTAAAVAAALTAACGSSGMYSDTCYEEAAEAEYDMADNGQYYSAAGVADSVAYPADDVAVAEEAAEVKMETAEGAGSGTDGLPAQGVTEKKLIRNVNLEVETTEFDALLAGINSQVEAMGGYVENFSSSNYSSEDVRRADIVARIPSDGLDGFLDNVSQQSNVVYRSESVDDVTLQYVDLDTRKKAMTVERDRLLELLEQAETVADIIEIESRLSEINYEIESLEARLRTIDNQVTYSTVYINICEVKVYTPVADKTIWQKIGDGFGNNVYNLLNDMENIVIGFIVSLPYIFVWVVIIAAVIVAIKLCQKAFGKSRAKRAQKRQQKQEAKALRGQAQDDYMVIPTGNERERQETEKDEQDGKTI